MTASSQRRDPFPVFCFKVVLSGVESEAAAFFRSVSGLKSETEVTDFQEGGQNEFTHRLVGSTKWGNIVLKRGFSKSDALIEWRKSWVEAGGQKKRINGKIIQLDTQLKPMYEWEFQEGWPCKWEIAEFDASKSELAIETLEIAHHGLKFTKKW
ncbi:phage tail protein [Haliangium sp.]|uniref:phage tail protein n=1 Tax=Haliangium sp. TaxID=2663208 RepID=UPI003D097845